VSDLSKQDWSDWLNHPATQAFYRHLDAEWGAGGARFEGTLAFGGGFRFNNPYRLRTYLGGSAESRSEERRVGKEC